MGLFSKKNKKEETSTKVPADKKDQAKAKKVEPKAVKAVPKKKSTKTAKPASQPGKVNDKKAISAYRVLIRPIISEKTTMSASLNKYVFEVATRANKVEVKQAVEEAYGVKPVSVNIIKSRGKVVRRGRYTGRTKDIKKAIVTLAKGDSIKLYEGI